MGVRRGALLLAAGRVVLGTAIMLALERVTSRWLGEENADHPVVGDLARGLAARDIALGIAALVSLDDPVAGPRVQAGCAAADAVDAIATVIARESLPRKGVAGAVLVAGASAVAASTSPT
jgi:hypothetical protein